MNETVDRTKNGWSGCGQDEKRMVRQWIGRKTDG